MVVMLGNDQEQLLLGLAAELPEACFTGGLEQRPPYKIYSENKGIETVLQPRCCTITVVQGEQRV